MFGIRNVPVIVQQIARQKSVAVAKNPQISTQISSVISYKKDTPNSYNSYRFITHSSAKRSEKPSAETNQSTNGENELTEYHAYDMIHKLSDNERASLSKALSKFNSDKIKSKFQGNSYIHSYKSL